MLDKSEEYVLKFLKVWISGDEETLPDIHSMGLCGNLVNWLYDVVLELYSVEEEEFLESCSQKLTELFEESGLDTMYPFGKAAYAERAASYTMTESSMRRSWVEETIAKLEAKYACKE